MLNWNDLKYFVAIARHGSTISASKALGLSQSTVYRRIMALEKSLGCRLVRRHPTGYRLTSVGESLQAHAANVENAVASFERQVSAAESEMSGLVRVACPEALGSRLVRSGLIEKFNDQFPRLRVELMMSDRIVDLANGEADIAFRGVAPTDRTLYGRKIARSPWALYASKDYVKRQGDVDSAKDLNRHAVIQFSGTMRDHPAARWLHSAAPEARVAASAGALPAVLLSVKSGAGIAPLPVIIGDEDSDLLRLSEPLIELPTDFYLLIHEDMKRTPRVRTFYDFIIGELPAFRAILTPRELTNAAARSRKANKKGGAVRVSR